MNNIKSEECVELKNIQYQTMLLNNNNNNLLPKQDINIVNIDAYLDKEIQNNNKKPWSKLGTAIKLKKIKEYIDIYSVEEKLNKTQREKLYLYLTKLLERKKLQKIKEVTYDVENGTIKTIPGLIYNKTTNRFTIKKNDKAKSSLKTLAPKTLKKKGRRRKSKDKRERKTKHKKEKSEKTKKESKK